MTAREYAFISRIRYQKPSEIQTLTIEEHAMIARFKKDKWIGVNSNGDYYVRDLGLSAMLEFEDELHEEARKNAEAKEERKSAENAEEVRWREDARRSWIQFWLGALFSCIGFGAGVFVEHYFTILEIILAFLH